MNPLRPLEAEHRLIETALDAMTSLLALAGRKHRLSSAPFLEFERFVHTYADEAHHAKEEFVLFPEMAKKGLPLDSGPLGCMLNEHNHGRNFCLVIGTSARLYENGDEAAYPDMLDATKAFAQLLRAHIQKEDQVLYPMALRLLGEQTLLELEQRFRAVDAHGSEAFENAAFRVVWAADKERQRLLADSGQVAEGRAL